MHLILSGVSFGQHFIRQVICQAHLPQSYSRLTGGKGKPAAKREHKARGLTRRQPGYQIERESLWIAKRAGLTKPVTSVTRREFLRRTGNAALSVAILSQAGLLSGCGGTTIWDQLARRLRGPLVRPVDASYRSLHLPFNRRCEGVRAEGIASCLDPSDVRESILWAREHNVPVAIRSGGHNYAGYSTTEGLLIDLGRMRAVAVDDGTGVATVPGSSNEDGGGFAMFALGGAISHISQEKTAYVHRDLRFLLAIDSAWTGGDSDRTEQANIDWVEGFADAMRAYTTEYAYQNFIDSSQANPAHAHYGDNLDRLVRIKGRRDPENFFHFPQSVPQRSSGA